jgi:hypothetical protein
MRIILKACFASSQNIVFFSRGASAADNYQQGRQAKQLASPRTSPAPPSVSVYLSCPPTFYSIY